METEAGTHSEALSWAHKFQLKSGRNVTISKEDKTMGKGETIETFT